MPKAVSNKRKETGAHLQYIVDTVSRGEYIVSKGKDLEHRGTPDAEADGLFLKKQPVKMKVRMNVNVKVNVKMCVLGSG